MPSNNEYFIAGVDKICESVKARLAAEALPGNDSPESRLADYNVRSLRPFVPEDTFTRMEQAAEAVLTHAGLTQEQIQGGDYERR